MSNSEIIYWIGEDIDKNNKNKTQLERNFSFQNFPDLKNAFAQLKKIRFEFVFVIINCKLFEEFAKVYNKEFTKENSVIITSIIFCDNVYAHINNKNVNDPFINPGGITDDIQGVINYIRYVQNSWYNFPKNENYLNLSVHHSEGFGKMFFQIVSDEKDFIIPIIWNKITSFKINGSNLAQLQKLLIYNHPSVKEYIYPTREKVFKITEHILAKYFLFLYTTESGFYGNMNRILSHDDGFDIYREYIKILFLSLKNKTFNNFTKKNYSEELSLIKKNLKDFPN